MFSIMFLQRASSFFFFLKKKIKSLYVSGSALDITVDVMFSLSEPISVRKRAET